MVSLHSEKPISSYALHPVSQKFPQCCLWNSSSVRLIDNGPLSAFQGGSSSASSFHASLLQVIRGVMSLALCPRVVFQRFEIIWLAFKTSYQFIKMPSVAICCRGRHVAVAAAAVVMLVLLLHHLMWLRYCFTVTGVCPLDPANWSD